jgi:hypothetical protein
MLTAGEQLYGRMLLLVWEHAQKRRKNSHSSVQHTSTSPLQSMVPILRWQRATLLAET